MVSGNIEIQRVKSGDQIYFLNALSSLKPFMSPSRSHTFLMNKYIDRIVSLLTDTVIQITYAKRNTSLIYECITFSMVCQHISLDLELQCIMVACYYRESWWWHVVLVSGNGFRAPGAMVSGLSQVSWSVPGLMGISSINHLYLVSWHEPALMVYMVSRGMLM